MSSTGCPWKCPSRCPRGWEQSKNPPGAAGTTSREYWDDWSLAKWHFPSKCFGRLGNLWWAPRVPSPQCVEGRGSSQHPPNPWEAGSSQSWKESFCFIHPINEFHFPFSDWCRSSQTTDWIYTEFNLKQDNAAGEDSKINFTPPPNNPKPRKGVLKELMAFAENPASCSSFGFLKPPWLSFFNGFEAIEVHTWQVEENNTSLIKCMEKRRKTWHYEPQEQHLQHCGKQQHFVSLALMLVIERSKIWNLFPKELVQS